MRNEKKGRNTSEDLRKIRNFIEFAKSSVAKGLALGQDFDGLHVVYNGFWTYFSGVDSSVSCQLPEDTAEIAELPDCARDCWKLLMFRSKPEDIETSVNLLFPLLKDGEIKRFKHNGDARNDEISPDAGYVIVIYTWGIEERDKLKAKLHSIGFSNIPYRRGCKMFEGKFGHWKEWFRDEE